MNKLLLSDIKESTFVFQALTDYDIDFVYCKKASFKMVPHLRFKRRVPHLRFKRVPHLRFKRVLNLRLKRVPHIRFTRVPHTRFKRVLYIKFKRVSHFSHFQGFHTQTVIHMKVSFNLFHATSLF